MPESQLFLIDGHALCYRSYFAIKGLSTSKGQATNAVYGFANTLRKILRDYHPEYLAVCFDVGKKTHRQEKFAAYKIQRPAMPSDLVSQIPLIKEIVRAYRFPLFELEGFEADDMIATVVKKMRSKGLGMVIVSDDKDMLQLVDERIKVYSARQDKFFGSQEAVERLGVEPGQIADFIGLAGDQADNIPGVAGIGEVTAKNLIHEFKTLENLFANLDRVKSPKVREKLSAQKDMALFSRELSVLDSDAPIHVDLDDLKVKAPDQNRLFEIFKELEFRKFAQESAGETVSPAAIQVKTITSKKDIKGLVFAVQEKGHFAFLFDHPKEAAAGRARAVAMSLGGTDVFLLGEDAWPELSSLFASADVLKITHNIKEGLKSLTETETSVRGKVFDVLLAGYLLAPAHSTYDIENLSWIFLKHSVPSQDLLAGEVSCLYEMYSLMLEELKQKSLLKLFEDVEIPLASVLFKMETAGVNLDQKLLEKLSLDCQKEIQALEKELYELAGIEFNLNSPKQLSQVLFEKLKLPVVKKIKTGFSTDEGVLSKLAEQHRLPARILDYRQIAKLKSTYIDALPKLIDRRTGRLHASFNQAGTETGRLSSHNPNLQNIPIRTDLGRQIRRAFIPSEKERLILAADYSQIELRILAHLSEDENLIRAFQQGEDIHRYTASLIFDVREDAVTDEMRDRAKRVNFGIIYGMSAFGLSKDLNISPKEAQGFIDRYFLRYPGVKKFMDQEIKKCEEQGFVVTLLNRRRYIPEISSPNMAIKQFAQRQAINTPVQGSAADLIKLAMIHIQKEIEERKMASLMIITVHDELVFDVVRDELKDLDRLIREQMEHPLKLLVPIKVTVKVGPNWLDAKEI
ncbi:MAG: DNA polymerase I [Candidatus Omnitrophota bacterium]